MAKNSSAVHVAPGTMNPTVKQAATILGVVPRTVERLVAAGELPRVKIGRAVRIPLTAIADYLERNTETPNMTDRERAQVLADQRAALMGEVAGSGFPVDDATNRNNGTAAGKVA